MVIASSVYGTFVSRIVCATAQSDQVLHCRLISQCHTVLHNSGHSSSWSDCVDAVTGTCIWQHINRLHMSKCPFTSAQTCQCDQRSVWRHQRDFVNFQTERNNDGSDCHKGAQIFRIETYLVQYVKRHTKQSLRANTDSVDSDQPVHPRVMTRGQHLPTFCFK